MSVRKYKKRNKMVIKERRKQFKRYHGKGPLNSYLIDKNGKKFRFKQWINSEKNIQLRYINKLRKITKQLEN